MVLEALLLHAVGTFAVFYDYVVQVNGIRFHFFLSCPEFIWILLLSFVMIMQVAREHTQKVEQLF